MAGCERGWGVAPDSVVTAAKSVAGEGVRTVVLFDREEFDVVYVDDRVEAIYEDEAHMHSHFEEIHSYVNVDFTERELFTAELFPVAEGVRYMATGLDFSTIVRVYLGDEGVFLAVDPGVEIEAVVRAIEEVANITYDSSE